MGEDVAPFRVRDCGAKLAMLAWLGIVGAFVLGLGLISAAGALEPGDVGTVSVEPSTDLVDRQTVAVSATGFAANTFFGAAQCDPSAGPGAGTAGCDLSTARTTTTDANGEVQLDLVVRRVIVVQGQEIDCALSPCTVAAATLEGTTPIEAASAPISFDPSVPPAPRLQVEVTVEEVTTSGATGTVTCNRSAETFLQVRVEQSKGGAQSVAFGFADEPTGCEVTPTEWEVRFTDGQGVLRGGRATYDVYASAYDGFESAEVQRSGEVKVSGGGNPTFEPIDRPGETVSVEVLGSTSGAGGLAVNLAVVCDRSVPTGSAFVSVTQRVGLDMITGFGFADFGPCDGLTVVSVPVSGVNGRLAGGPAEVSANVQISDFLPENEFYDFASSTAAVRLQGSTRLGPIQVQPNPDSRIVISGSTRSELTGTVTCEEPASVQLFTEVLQPGGRKTASSVGFTVIDCDGATGFTVPLEGDVGPGSAAAFVYATGYREIEGSDEYEYLWDDQQSASLRI